MDDEIKSIFKIIGLDVNHFDQVNGLLISRETLLSDDKYEELKFIIPELKKNYSSSFMTSLQKNADKSQKWPLLNLVRQILHVYGYGMEPIRKSDGYTLEGIKKYKRFFLIHKKNNNGEIKKIELNNQSELENTIIKENEY